MGSSFRDKRTPDQILRSVMAYLAWRAGDCWRTPANPKLRNDQDRWDYLSALRQVEAIRYSDPSPKPHIVAAPPDPLLVSLLQQPRAWLVSEILRADDSLTDRKILSHLPRTKLARMLMERRARLDLAASLYAPVDAGRPRPVRRVEIYDTRKAATA